MDMAMVAENTKTLEGTKTRKPFYLNLTFQVIVAIIIGGLLGHFYPQLAEEMKPLATLFTRLIKMIIGPIVFLTIVIGISSVGDVKKVGKVGVKALIYFEVITTFALGIGLLVVNITQPGKNLSLSAVEKGDVSQYVKANADHSTVDFLMGIVPDNVVSAFAQGNLLQIIFFAILFGIALSAMQEKGKVVEDFFERVVHALFGVIGLIMKVAPLGAFGAIAFTTGKYGLDALLPLLKVMLDIVLTMAIFIFGVLGIVAKYYGFSVWKFVVYLKEELIIALGTSSSETVLPRLMQKTQAMGCDRSVVGLVVPMGYSFNLDGTSIYLSMAALFIAQAYNIDLSIGQQLTILGILMITSKGAAGVAGSGFITLAATLSATHVLPVEGMALLLGIDFFMSVARTLTNLIGNGIATVVIAKMEKEFDEEKALKAYSEAFGKEVTKI